MAILTQMIVCGTCGNKRCPKATDHNYQCTDSNEPGQPGSRYTADNQRQSLVHYDIPNEFDELDIDIEVGSDGYLLIRQGSDCIALPGDRIGEIARKLIELVS